MSDQPETQPEPAEAQPEPEKKAKGKGGKRKAKVNAKLRAQKAWVTIYRRRGELDKANALEEELRKKGVSLD